MDDETAARYLNQRVVIPESLREPFDGATQLTRSRMAEVLSGRIGLRADHQPVLVVGLLQVLVESLGRALRDEQPLEHRGVALSSALFSHFTIDECVAVAEYFGWSDLAVGPDTMLAALGNTVRRLLTERLGARLDRTLGEWSGAGAVSGTRS